MYDYNKEIVKLMLDNGANINGEHGDEHTPLEHAILCDEPEIVTMLIERGVDLPEDTSDMISIMEEADWWTELHTAVINNDLDKIQRYEYFSSDLNPLDLTIMIGNLAAAKALITLGIKYDINACLRKAIFARRNELAEFFL